MKTLIVVLSVLLGLTLVALAGVVIYGLLDPTGGVAVIPDNYIDPSGSQPGAAVSSAELPAGPALLCAPAPMVNSPATGLSKTLITSDSTKNTEISLYKNHAQDSQPFRCANMFPGDSQEQAYLVRVSHKGTVTVCFHADIRAGYEKLAEVLNCKVVLQDKVLYDGLMSQMPPKLDHAIPSASAKTTELAYDITVYLDTSVGNEYMNKELIADFSWWVEEDSQLVDPPKTGDEGHLCVWFWIAMVSLLINLIFLWPKRRKNAGKGKEAKADE